MPNYGDNGGGGVEFGGIALPMEMGAANGAALDEAVPEFAAAGVDTTGGSGAGSGASASSATAASPPSSSSSSSTSTSSNTNDQS